jgi:hypothetical protein
MAEIKFRIIILIFLFANSASFSGTPKIGNNIYSSILINMDSGYGSGVFFLYDSTVYLVTAKHIIYKDSNDLDLQSNIINLTSYNSGNANYKLIDIDLKKADSLKKIFFHKKHDVVCIPISKTKHDITQVVYEQYVKSYSDTNSANTCYKLYDSVIISNDAYICGYPVILGIDFNKIDVNEPLLRRGIIAGKNHQKKTIVVDCPTYKGNSGGPVIEVDEENGYDKISLIGIVSESVPYQEKWRNIVMGYLNTNIYNSGYTIVEPIDFVIETIKEHNKSNNEIK